MCDLYNVFCALLSMDSSTLQQIQSGIDLLHWLCRRVCESVIGVSSKSLTVFHFRRPVSCHPFTLFPRGWLSQMKIVWKYLCLRGKEKVIFWPLGHLTIISEWIIKHRRGSWVIVLRRLKCYRLQKENQGGKKCREWNVPWTTSCRGAALTEDRGFKWTRAGMGKLGDWDDTGRAE